MCIMREIGNGESHSVALSAFEEPTQNMIALVSEETWPTISMPSNAILSMHKPDFTVAFRVGPHSKMPKLKARRYL